MNKNQKITLITILTLITIFIKNKISKNIFNGKSRTLSINSPFGPRGGGMHLGVDFAGKTGEKVYVKKSGKVLRMESKCVVGNLNCGGGWGNFVEIEHTPEIKTIYAHLTNVFVKSGDKINKNQIIGTIGNTGHSFGAHLHFEYWVKNVRIDGTKYANEYLGIEQT